MDNNSHSTEPSAKNFFSTLPGIITAVAGLITALGGFILILNETGCMSSNGNLATKEHQVSQKSEGNQSDKETNNDNGSGQNNTGSQAAGNITYSPKEVKNVLKNVFYRISSANIQSLPSGKLILTLKVKCVNDHRYEYHFYSHSFRLRVGEDNYAAEHNSPSNSYESVPANSFKDLEYNYILPAGTKTFNLVIYDEKEEMGTFKFDVK